MSVPSIFAARRIVLGITGGIAAYKSADLCRRLIGAGADVHCVMTEAATRFVGVTTFDALSGQAVACDGGDDSYDSGGGCDSDSTSSSSSSYDSGGGCDSDSTSSSSSSSGGGFDCEGDVEAAPPKTAPRRPPRSKLARMAPLGFLILFEKARRGEL